MSVQKRPNNKYRARVMGPEGKEVARHFTLKKEAVAWEAEQKAAIARGTYVDPNSKTTFSTFYEEWKGRQVWLSRTLKGVDLTMRTVSFGHVALVKIRRAHVERWVKEMADQGLAPGTIKTRTQHVRSVFRGAVRDRLIPFDPAEGVVLPRRRRAEAALVLPTAEQVAGLLDAAEPSFQALIALAAFAGLRHGEICGLQLGDIDFPARTLKVSRQIQRGPDASSVICAPKYGSERLIYLADGLIEFLAAHVLLMKDSKERWLFMGNGIEPAHQNWVHPRWRRTCKRAGVSGLTLHSLRHWYASGQIASGADVVTVQKALGHASPTTTLGVYGHMFPSAESKTRTGAQALVDLVASIRTTAENTDTMRTGSSSQAA